MRETSTVQTGGSFVYETDMRKVRRQGTTEAATGKPMQEALSSKISAELLTHALNTYCRHIAEFDAHKGVNGLPADTIFHEMRKLGLLSEEQYRAAEMIYQDALNSWGKSGGQTSSYREATSTGSNPGKVVMPRTNKHYDRLYRLGMHLHDCQKKMIRMVIEEIVLGKERKIDMFVIGRRLSDYKGRDQARALASGHWQAFLNSVAEFYRLDIRRTQKRVIQVRERTQFEPVKLEK